MLERKRGKKITAKGCYRDACRSSNSLVVKSFGLKWLCAALIIKFPWSNRYWALPFMTILCTSKKHDELNNLKHKTSIDRTMQMVYIISRLLKRRLVLLGDGGFAYIRLGHSCTKSNVALVSRLRLDAALFNEAVVSTEKRRGRRPIKGTKIATLKQQLKDGEIQWQEHKVAWYGRKLKSVKLSTGINLWYKSGEFPLKIRWVIVMDQDTNKTEAFFSTDINMPATTIVENFVLRWNLEVTFEEVRANLGVETQRQWSTKSIRRTTPLLMGTFSLVCLIAHLQSKITKDLIPTISAAWYNKQDNATFSDVLIYVKKLILRENYINLSSENDDFVQISKQKLADLINIGLMNA